VTQLARLATASVIASLLAACGGGGGGGSAPAPAAAVPTAAPSSSSAKATASITFTYPANFHVATNATAASTARTKPAYVNPSSSDFIIVYANGVYATPSSGIALSSITPNANGSQTLTVSVPSGDDFIEVQEVDANDDILAYGNTYFSFNAGQLNQLSVTMLMNATNIVLTSNLQGTDATLLNPDSTVSFCYPASATVLFVAAADASGGFVLPGTPTGDGQSQDTGYPGVPTPSLVNFYSANGGTSTLPASSVGYVPTFDSAQDPIYAQFQTLNPYLSSQYGSNQYASAYAEIGPSTQSPCPPGTTFSVTGKVRSAKSP